MRESSCDCLVKIGVCNLKITDKAEPISSKFTIPYFFLFLYKQTAISD